MARLEREFSRERRMRSRQVGGRDRRQSPPGVDMKLPGKPREAYFMHEARFVCIMTLVYRVVVVLNKF
jgi:hypothetical protein